MAAVSRLWDRIELSRAAYPGVIVGSGLVAVGVVALVLPDVLEFFIGQINRVAGLGSTDTAATVGEAQAVDNPTQFFFRSYGLAFYTALAGLALMLYRAAASERPPAEYLFMSVFLALMILFTLSQQRFDYYLVLGVGAANAYLVGWIYQFVDLDNVRENITTIKPYQVLIVVAILFVVAGPLVVTGATTSAADRASNPGEMRLWGESLDWMDEETPEVGAYGTGDNDTRLETYGTYEITDDFQYEEGEYGVLAWWDYGHYITQRGERIPVANPFQQRAGLSADFLLAADESNATELLDEQAGEGEGVRYVVVDYKLAYAGTQKYNAPTAFESEYNIGSSDIGVSVFQQGQGVVYGAMTQRGYESMRARLYQFHGSARQAGTVVTQFGEYDQQRGLATRTGEDRRPFRTFNSSEAAAEAAAQDPNAIHGGVLGQPAERVEALEHFRLVHGSERTFRTPVARATGQEPESYIKTFERVDGATIEGTGPANAEVQANVAMEIPTTGQEFVYRQFAQTDENGNFEMTVPYSTTGYDEWGTEAGYTDVSVRANSSYQFIASGNGTWTGQTEVTEGQVLGENETAATVELERALSVGRGGGSGSGGAGGSESGGSSSEDTQGRQTARTP
jgi:dolichyl-diphosphooligosaccharide--protein glycosyltransferase